MSEPDDTASHRSIPMVDRWTADAAAWKEGLANGSISPHPVPLVEGNWRESKGAARLHKIRGLVIGSAVGDALGAPFEFGPPGAFSARFPVGATENEMIGGGVWEPGEFTDDTQMAILEALSIVERGGVDEADIFSRFQAWASSNPKDVGNMTRAVLTDPVGWPAAPQTFFQQNPANSAGNGGLMRAGFTAARWCMAGNYTGTAEIGRRLSRVTHVDPAAAEGRALFHMMCWEAFMSDDPFADIERHLSFVKDAERPRYVDALGENPPTDLPNGSVWGCLRDAVAAVRGADSFEEVMRRACDVGDDVDTVAAVAGGLAGVTFGLHDIPARWIESLHGSVMDETYRANDLLTLVDRLRLTKIERFDWAPNDRSWLPDS